MSNSALSLLNEGKFSTAELWKSDKGFLALTNDETVGKTGGEGVTIGILDMDNLVGTWMVLGGHKDTGTTNIVTALDEDHGTVLEFDNSVNLSSSQVKLNASNTNRIKYN